MKTKKWTFATAVASVLLLGSSCQDWGEADPPAAGQIKPTLEKVAEFSFDEETGLDPFVYKLTVNNDGTEPAIVEDAERGKVLSLNNGYVTVKNPLNSVSVQDAVSFTFWMMQPVLTSVDEGGEEVVTPQDIAGPIFTFENGSGNGRFYFNANGQLWYDAMDGIWTDNDPAVATTGYLPAGEWHYVALVIGKTGYKLYVDGDQKVNKTVVGFDCSKIMHFLNQVPTMTFGAAENSSPVMIDQFTLYRNELTDKEIARPGSGSGPVGGIDLGSFDYYSGEKKLLIGASDCSTPFWSEFSDYFRLPANTSFRLSFVNHTSGGGNWNNWNIGITTDAERGGDGYEEYLVLRSDLFGWGASYEAGTWESSGYDDWAQFLADMEGANVVIDVVRNGAEVSMTAVATSQSGRVYREKFTTECGDGEQVIRAFLLVDGSHLVLDPKGCYPYWPITLETTTVGATDNSTPFWEGFSDYFQIPSNLSLHLGFINHTSGAGNWNNWNLCLSTDDERGGGDYSEYIVIRSDLYGWGESYVGDNWTSEGYGDWDQFRVDMEGADVELKVVRDGADTSISAVAKSTGGSVYKETITAVCGDGSQTVRAFLVTDGSHFVMKPAECYTYKPIYE